MKVNKVVIFKIEDEEYAADIMQIERILDYTEPTKIPEAPPFIKGIIKYQEKILPIIDLKTRMHLSLSADSYEPKIIVVKNDDKYIGLIVDMVLEVIDISSESIEETPTIIKCILNKYVFGIVKLNDRIIILLDTEKIISIDEMIELNSLQR
jgi:purine-binding chemotaxis protein CheW